MTVIWQKETLGKRYRVTRAGNSTRLYTNRAFHSQYNPDRPFAGAVWDILTLPALYSPRAPDTVLMLGVGGGAAIRQINAVISPRHLTGIELDPVHIHVARKFFGCSAANVDLIEADALKWTRKSRARFDWVIDDLFLDAIDDPQRPVAVDADWLRQLEARVGPKGLLVQNHLSPALARRVVTENAGFIRKRFKTGLLFTVPAYTNGILALYRERVPDLRRARTRAVTLLKQAGIPRVNALNYAVKVLFP